MAGASTLSFVNYPSLDEPQRDFEDQVELVPLIHGEHNSEVVEKMPIRASPNDATLMNFPKSFNDAHRSQHSEGTLSRRCPEDVWSGCFAQATACLWSFTMSCYQVLSGSKISWLLPAAVISLIATPLKVPQAFIFALSLIGIAPLAERLGYVTEQLAFYTGPTVGGLLNATFGNATELIISLFALNNGLIRVVQLSLLGSILSNMLLVLGCAFFFGGLAHPQNDQKFNQAAAVVNSSLLLMAVMGLLFPAVLHSTHTEVHAGISELNLSRFSSCIMLLAYFCYLYFQLKSHKQLYDTPNEDEGGNVQHSVEEEEAELSLRGALIWLAILTLFISVLSDILVNAIEGASTTLGIPLAFISVIILPIVGNAAEHASAIMFALKDKLDLSLAVAIGSSTQISMFVIPLCVVVGWIKGKPMHLNFQLFETATLFTTVIVVAFMLQEGKSNYFKGLMLVLCYLIVGASFFVHIDGSNQAAEQAGKATGDA